MPRKVLLLAVALAWALCCRAQEPPSPDTASGLLSFGDNLLRGGDGFRAATEYLRLLHHFPSAPEALPALQGLGRAYGQAGRWDDAAGAYGQLLDRAPGTETRLLLGGALYKGGHFARASTVVLSGDTTSEGATLGTLAALRAGRIHNLPPGTRADVAAEYSALPQKSPLLAGTLAAVLPGAGHLYCDRPRDALTAFLLNAVFIAGTVEAARRDLWAVAGIVGAFELGWYSGNIVSATNAAYKWNRREESRFFQRHEAGALPDLTLFPTASGGQLAMSWIW